MPKGVKLPKSQTLIVGYELTVITFSAIAYIAAYINPPPLYDIKISSFTFDPNVKYPYIANIV